MWLVTLWSKYLLVIWLDTPEHRVHELSLPASLSQVEEHKFKELREGARREASTRQASQLAEAARNEESNNKMQVLRSKVAKQAARDKASFFDQYEERLANLTQQSRGEQALEAKQRATRAGMVRTRERTQRQAQSSSSYVPFTGSKTTLQARLAAIAGEGKT